MLTIRTPQSGQHNDLDIDAIFKEMLEILEQAGISCKGVFLNTDPGFDSEEMKLLCEQKEIELNAKTNKRTNKQTVLE